MSGKAMQPVGICARKFKVGQRVESTALALRNGVVKKPCRGRVVGFSYGGYSVRVLRDLYKLANAYHPDFWVRRPRRARKERRA